MLMALLIVAAAALPTKLEGGLWTSPDGKVQIQFHGLNFAKLNPKTGSLVQCVTSWPIRDPQAAASCEDGMSHKLYFDMDSGVIIFDDVSLQQSEGEALD